MGTSYGIEVLLLVFVLLNRWVCIDFQVTCGFGERVRFNKHSWTFTAQILVSATHIQRDRDRGEIFCGIIVGNVGLGFIQFQCFTHNVILISVH